CISMLDRKPGTLTMTMPLAPSHFEIIEDALSRLTAFVDGGHHQVGTTYHVATGKDLLVGGLESEGTMLRSLYTTTLVKLDAYVLEPRRRARLEAKGDYHCVGSDDFLGPRHHFRTLTPLLIWFTQAGTHDLDAFDTPLSDHRHRLTIEQEVDPLFSSIGHFATRARHVLFITAIGTGHSACPLANGGTVAVHGRITTAQHHHLLVCQRNEIARILLEAQAVIDVGN